MDILIPSRTYYLKSLPNILLVIIIISGLSLPVTGQDDVIPPRKLIKWNIRLPERLSIGIMAGSNLSLPLITHSPQNTYDFMPDVKLKPGWQVGLAGEIKITGKYILHINIQYQSLTAHSEYHPGDYKDTFNEQLQLISIPLAITYKLGKGGIRYYPMSGFSFNCLAYSKINYTYHPYADIPTYSYEGHANLLSDRNLLNFSAVLGGGFNYQIRKYFLVLELGYYHDLRNYINTDLMRITQIISEYGIPFFYQSPGFRMHGLFLNLVISKAHH